MKKEKLECQLSLVTVWLGSRRINVQIQYFVENENKNVFNLINCIL